MSDHAKRMFSEALARLHDADILAQSMQSESDSQALLRILGFEVLLKCALLVCGQKPKANHNYNKLWSGLPAYAQESILGTAANRMPGYVDLSNLKELFWWYQYIFEKARYHYELYEGYSLQEQQDLGDYWLELGAPTQEAVVRYHPSELRCLTEGLKVFIEQRLSVPLSSSDAPTSGASVS